MKPTPRHEVLDAYWHLAAERQNILFRRLSGQPGPWTSDPILGSFKFCNAYRASDRVSQYLIRRVIYTDQTYTAEDQLLRIVLFRLFSKPSTWELLTSVHGDVTWSGLRRVGYARTLDDAFAAGEKLYTAAFILCATSAYGHARKHRNHLALVEHMIGRGDLALSVARAKSLGDVYEALREFPLIGPFMAYQLAIDINYSELCSFSESEQAVAGPGARRGIAKCFTDSGGWDDQQVILWMTEHQEQEFARRGLEFSSLYGRPLQAIDIQNLFCELDKYSRVAFPELRSNRSRIKSRFSSAGPLPPPFYPPKWGLDVTSPARANPAEPEAADGPGMRQLQLV